jgi:hypothetical protein
MADNTALTQCLVFVDKRAALLGVTLEAGLISAQESQTAAFQHLLHIRLRTFNSHPGMRVVTIGAAHFALEHRMMVRQLKRRANFQVTLETSFRRLTRIDNSVRRTSALYVETAGTVAGLTANVLRVFALCLEPRMRGRAKIAHDLFVAGPAFL